MRHFFFVLPVMAALLSAGLAGSAKAASSPEELVSDSNHALHVLTSTNPAAAAIAKQARAVLIFPNIVKAGLVFGGAYGEGVLKQGGKVDGYYNFVMGSWGLQLGAQSYASAMFLMNDKALQYLHQSHGWEIGTGPSVALINQGVEKDLNTSSLRKDAYVFVFNQQGLMASLSIEGAKISHIHNP